MLSSTRGLWTITSALAMIAGCHGTSDAGSGAGRAAPPAGTSPASAAGAISSVTAASAASSTAQLPTVTGSQKYVTLAGGAKLTLPAGAKPREMKNRSGLPQSVSKTHLFRFGDRERLMITEMSKEGKSCDALLDEQLERANQAKGDTDPSRLQLRRVAKAEVLSIGGSRVLYSESKNRLPSQDAGSASVTMGSLIMCRGDNHLVVMYASDQPVQPKDLKKLLTDVAASYKPVAK
jgi:hypothetical protein